MINQADLPVSLADSDVDSLNISFCFLVCAVFGSRWEAFARPRPADALTWSAPAASALAHARELSPAERPPFEPVLWLLVFFELGLALLGRKNKYRGFTVNTAIDFNSFFILHFKETKALAKKLL